jgi:competence protein ComEA
VELVRPVVPDSARQRLARLFAGVTPGRIASSAGALLVVSLGSWWLLRAPAPPIERSLPLAARSATSPSLVAPPSLAPAELVVQMAGAVRNPGVYHLPTGSRVADLVIAAGGAADGVDPAVLALAAKLADGQRIYLARPGETGVASGVSGPGGSGSGASAGPLDLNAATVEQLDALPGVGPATAAAIIAYRDKHGPLRSVDDLLQIRGLGASKVDALRALVRV